MERTYAAPSGSGVPTTQWRPSRRIAGPQRDRATGHATPERGRPGAPPLRDVRQPDDRDRDTVGTLLAAIANSINDGLTLMRFADKRQWGPDEFEQVRALERCLDSAKRDFQELSALLNGQTYYTGDTTSEFPPCF